MQKRDLFPFVQGYSKVILLLLLMPLACFTNGGNQKFSSPAQNALLKLKQANPPAFQKWAETWNEQVSLCTFRGIVCHKDTRHVTEIHLWDSELQHLPTDILFFFPDLEVLDLSQNQLKELTIDALPKLRALYADSNQIAAIHITEVPSLEKLSVANNKLTFIDELDFPKLWTLDISKNQLSTFSIKKLPALKHFFAQYNQLSTVINLFEHESLGIINVANNPNLAGTIPQKWCHQIRLPVNQPVSCIQSENPYHICPPLYPFSLYEDPYFEKHEEHSDNPEKDEQEPNKKIRHQKWIPFLLWKKTMHIEETKIDGSCRFSEPKSEPKKENL